MSENGDRVREWPVSVALPGGRIVEGGLLSRRRDDAGRWWYRVALDIPVAAVRPVDGHDYTGVPTYKPEPAGWVLEALRHDQKEQRALVLHTPGCWAAGNDSRLTPADSIQDVRIFLREGWATPCDACHPDIPPA